MPTLTSRPLDHFPYTLMRDRLTRLIGILEDANTAAIDRDGYQMLGILASADSLMNDVHALTRTAQLWRDADIDAIR